MSKVFGLIAAAGRGTRANLPYPKTLFPIQGTPILVRILKLFESFDPHPTVIVSPDGREAIESSLKGHRLSAELVTQPKPLGMGNAVLCFSKSQRFAEADHIVLLWGDIPFIQPNTLQAMIACHMAHENDMTFVTKKVEKAYTVVTRDGSGHILRVDETRELGLMPKQGEREVGLFIFRKTPVFEHLQVDTPSRFSQSTKEHGFLYVIGLLVRSGLRVEGLSIATALDIVSLNALGDLDGHL